MSAKTKIHLEVETLERRDLLTGGLTSMAVLSIQQPVDQTALVGSATTNPSPVSLYATGYTISLAAPNWDWVSGMSIQHNETLVSD